MLRPPLNPHPPTWVKSGGSPWRGAVGGQPSPPASAWRRSWGTALFSSPEKGRSYYRSLRGSPRSAAGWGRRRGNGDGSLCRPRPQPSQLNFCALLSVSTLHLQSPCFLYPLFSVINAPATISLGPRWLCISVIDLVAPHTPITPDRSR